MAPILNTERLPDYEKQSTKEQLCIIKKLTPYFSIYCMVLLHVGDMGCPTIDFQEVV